MDNTPAFHPMDYLSVLRRRKWWLIVPVALAIVVGAALAAFLPRQYQSTTVLGISLPTLTGQALADFQRLNAQERTRNLNQVLLSPPVLQRVVKEEGLNKIMSTDEAIQMVASGTQVRLPTPDPTVPPGSVEQFFIDFTGPSPDVAQRVANKLAEAFVDESSMKKINRSEQTSMFYNEQLEQSRTRLNDLEARLREAKEAYMGSLPEQTASNVALVNGLQQQLTNLSNEYRDEQARLGYIERELSASKPTLDAEPTLPGVPAASPAAVRVATLQKELDQALTVLTDAHPKVTNLKLALEAAKADAANEEKLPEEQRLATLKADPNYRLLVADRDQAKLRLEALDRQKQAIGERIGMYTNRVDAAPRVEQQIQSLDREYTLEKKNYEQLTAQLKEAELAEGVERSQGGERFTILASAPYPSAPSSPDVPRLMVITIVLGICLGGALALGREYLDRSIYDARALNDLDLPVLGEIPRISHV